MTCLHRIAFVFAFCGVAVGCSDHGTSDHSSLLRHQEELAPALSPTCGASSVLVPQAPVPLGSSFAATVTGDTEGRSYTWGGEAIRVVSQQGNRATLTCAWPGWHTLEVTSASPTCRSSMTAQVHCVPATCQSYSNVNECPGVSIKEAPFDCPKTNVLVRVKNDASCPRDIAGSHGVWRGGFLVDAPYGPSDSRGRFCAYHWTGRPSAPPEPSVLPANREDWTWDCPRVAAHGEYERMNGALAAHGQANLGTIQWSVPNKAAVHVAVVDTAAGDWRDADNSPHGKAVGTLILDTACPDPNNCSTRVSNYLGLPLLRDTESVQGDTVIRRDEESGGTFGTPSDLARAIVDAVDAAPNTRLVLNLSVAYDSDELPDTLIPNEMDFANRVVLAALRRARCRGALIFTAAGNGLVPADPEQLPGLPARWTALEALDANTCLKRYQVSRYPGRTPLLYAVGAVDLGSNSLLVTRGKGQSALTALGFAVVRKDPDGNYTRTLTGSSMAAGTVSGVAASLWSHVPQLSPDQIVNELYAASGSVPAVADFKPYSVVFPSPFSEVRRITRCSVAGANLGVATCLDLPEPVSTVPETILSEVPAGAPQIPAGPELIVRQGIDPSKKPWVRPQPDSNPPCPDCGLKLAYNRLDLVVRQSFLNDNPANMRLLVSKSSTIAAFAHFDSEGDVPENTPVQIASFTAIAEPFSVMLDEAALGTPIAAELAYQVTVDDEPVDLTASVLIEPDDEQPTEAF